jgi:hypothetical protein
LRLRLHAVRKRFENDDSEQINLFIGAHPPLTQALIR